MEDHNMVLINIKSEFDLIFKSIATLSKSPNANISNICLVFIEFFKEFYMNYPLIGQDSSITSCTFNEHEFYKAKDQNNLSYSKEVKPDKEKENSIEKK